MEELLPYLSALSVIPPIFISLVRYKSLNIALRLLFLLLLIAATADGTFLIAESGNFLTFTQNIYTLLESLIVSVIFFIEYKNKFVRWFIILFLLFLAAGTIKVILQAQYAVPNYNAVRIECCIMILLSFYFFYTVDADLHIPRGTEYPMFWFSFSMLFYFSTTLLLYLLRDYYDQSDFTKFIKLERLNSIDNILHNALLTIGIWQAKQK